MHTSMCTETDAEEITLSVFSPLILSQLLPGCQKHQQKHFSSIFQKGYDPTTKIIDEHMKHAIDSIFVSADSEKAERKQKKTVAKSAKLMWEEHCDPVTDFQKWLHDAVGKRIEYDTQADLRLKKKPKTTTTPVLTADDALRAETMSAHLATPPMAEYRETSDRINASVLKDAWARDRDSLTVLTSSGDGGRQQCVVTMNASGVLPASCRVAIAFSHALSTCTPQHWPFPHAPHVACDCFCVGIQMELQKTRTQMFRRCTRTSWTCLPTSWTAVFS